MDYFSMSPFYEKNSINYKCFVQNLDFNAQKFRMIGIEFNLEYFNKEKDLFYITKNEREKNKITLLSYYYVFKGTIYQSPDLYSLLLSNVESLTDNFINVIDKLNEGGGNFTMFSGTIF